MNTDHSVRETCLEPAAPGSGSSLAGTFVVAAICVPAVLGAYPIGSALLGIGFGPAGWVAVSWQLASMVIWTILATPILRLLRNRTDINIVLGRPALTFQSDLRALLPAMVLALTAHAVALSIASSVLALGRGRPSFLSLTGELLLLYAPTGVMTVIGLAAAAAVAAESRGREVETGLRIDLERQLESAQAEVVAAMERLNGPVTKAKQERPTSFPERMTVTSGGRSTLLLVSEIDWIEARSYYARLHVGARQHLVRQSMNTLEESLDPSRFARIHRSTIVNLDRVVEVRPHDRRSFVVVLRDGRRLMMSRRRRRLLDFVIP